MKLLATISVFILVMVSIKAQVVVTRGPYIQMTTQNSITIKWRTNTNTSSRVIYGLTQTSQTNTITESVNTTEHEVEITGLIPDTKYYYSVGNLTDIMVASANLYFFTLPPVNTIREYNFWVVGDCGTADDDQRSVRDAYQNYIGTTRVDGMIMLGDNAYLIGTDGAYQDALFNNMYENIISNVTMWPAPGNHDYYGGADAQTQSGPYYDIFTVPTAGQLGGIPSGTEAYYSYNIGNIHFISIDSYDSGRDSTNAMGNWIKQDLLNNTQQWTIAYWHHAPYSKGNHNSDNPFPYIDGELQEMREQIVPLMEKGGVDLVLCGHSHAYERSMMIDGHYGSSDSFNATHQVDNGSGDFITDCPYLKSSSGGDAHKGTVYTLLGVSGKKEGPGSGWPHPAMHTASTDHLGSIVLTIKGNRLEAKFITSTNTIHDQFTIIKDAGGMQTIPVCQGDQLVLQPSFETDQYTWMPGNINATSLTINPFFNSYYFGSDPMGCIKDTFQISVIQPGSPNDTCNWDAGAPLYANELVHLYPNPAGMNENLQLNIHSQDKAIFLEWLNLNGRSITTQYLEDGISTIKIPNEIKPGTYILKFYFNNNFYIHKLILTE